MRNDNRLFMIPLAGGSFHRNIEWDDHPIYLLVSNLDKNYDQYPNLWAIAETHITVSIGSSMIRIKQELNKILLDF